MKKLTFRTLVLVAGLVVSITQAEARDKRVKLDENSDAPAEIASSSKSVKFGLGFSNISEVTGSSAHSVLAALLELGPKSIVHGFIGIPGTAGSFKYTLGALYKHYLAGTASAGFHAGGGVELGYGNGQITGTGSDFGMAIAGVAGIHVAFPGTSNIMLHFDGGPRFALQNVGTGAAGAGGTSDMTTDFSLGGFSALLGMSIVYMF